MSDAIPFSMPPPDAPFEERGAAVIRMLMRDLGLTEIQAAAIVGNLGGESRLTAIQEVSPLAGRGGFGWAQWTGPRRDQFEGYCAAHNLQTTDDEANYGFLLVELKSTEAHSVEQLKKTTDLTAAVYTFEVLFERPSDPQGGLPPRTHYAERALAALHAEPAPAPQPSRPVPALPPPDDTGDTDTTDVDTTETPVPPPAPPPVILPPIVIPPQTPAAIMVVSRAPWWAQYVLGLYAITIFAGALFASCFLGNSSLLIMMFTAASVGFGTILGYFYGSSDGSRGKDDKAATDSANTAVALTALRSNGSG